MKISSFICLGLTALAAASTARAAAVIDLTTAGASGTDANGAIFQQVAPQPTGTGVIRSFVRIQSNQDIESGYNTDGRPLELDENNSPQFTRSLPLADLAIVNIDGQNYRRFLLDINQQDNHPLLSLSKLQIFQEDAPNITSYATLTSQGVKIYDLGAAVVKLDYSLNHGSGSGDMFLSVPDHLFTGAHPYVYLYSEFGRPIAGDGSGVANNSGFEEWAAVTAVPEPSSAAILMFAAGLVLSRRAKPSRL